MLSSTVLGLHNEVFAVQLEVIFDMAHFKYSVEALKYLEVLLSLLYC